MATRCRLTSRCRGKSPEAVSVTPAANTCDGAGSTRIGTIPARTTASQMSTTSTGTVHTNHRDGASTGQDRSIE